MPALVDIPGGITVEPPRLDLPPVADAIEAIHQAEAVWVDAWILAVEEGDVGDLAERIDARRRFR